MTRQFLLSATVACAVLGAADWPTPGGSPQRDGWAKSETAFTKENVKGLDLLYRYKADNQATGIDALTTPLINTRIITYLGFKEMLVFGGSSDNVYSVDADLNRLIWKRHLEYKADKAQSTSASSVCPGGLTASVIMAGSSTAGLAPRAPAGGRGVAAGGRGPARGGGNRSGEFYAVGSDGYLHTLNTSTGADRTPPVKFLPPNAKVSGLNVYDGVVYAATLDNCGGNPSAVYALDLSSDGNSVVSLTANGGSVAGSGGTAIGADGSVYVQAADLHGESGIDTVVKVTQKTLSVTDYFAPSGRMNVEGPGATPVVFPWKGKDVIVSGSRDGHVYLLDSSSLGGPDHHTPLSQTQYTTNGGFRGAFASWEDPASQTRWIYASSGSFVVGMRVEDRDGKPVLTQAWTSRDMIAPAPVVIANGVVFALATGDAGRAPNRAVLYALDADTGKELYSSGNITATWAHNSGLAVANRRIYFTTHDNVAYCFGFLAEQPQLTGK